MLLEKINQNARGTKTFDVGCKLGINVQNNTIKTTYGPIFIENMAQKEKKITQKKTIDFLRYFKEFKPLFRLKMTIIQTFVQSTCFVGNYFN